MNKTIQSLVKKIEKELIPRAIDGRYIPYQVQDIVDTVLAGKPLVSRFYIEKDVYFTLYSKKELKDILVDVSFDELLKLLREAHGLNIDYLVNALARIMVHVDRKQVKHIVEKQLESVPWPSHIHLKKHLRLVSSGDCNCGPQREYSIADYITEHPEKTKALIPTKDDFENRDADDFWITSFRGITSLYGIQFLDTVADLSYIRIFDMHTNDDDNFVSLLPFSSDPDFPKRPLAKFENLESIVVAGCRDIPSDLLYGLNKLKDIEIIAELPETLLHELNEIGELEFKTDAREMPDRFFGTLKNLKQLKLETSNIPLPVTLFEGLISLEKLCLSYNHSESLPEGILSCLTNLKQFESPYPGLGAFSQNMFEGLANLEEIDLRHSCLPELPAGIFSGLSQLKKLYLYGNRLQSLSSDIFRGLHNLEQLGLGSNDIEILPPDIFDDLTNLKHLALHANKLKTLPEGVFKGLDNLEYLSLECNELEDLSENIFEGLQELQELSLESNKLKKLPEGIFQIPENLYLEKLHLAYNQLETLPAEIFHGLTDLSYLNLSENYLKNIPDDLFRGLNCLEFLSFSTQDPVLPHELLWRRYGLRHLAISGKVRYLSSSFFQDLTKLKELSLSGCEEVELPENLPELLPHLEKLNLDGTRIKGKSAKDIEKWFAKHECVVQY